MADRWGEPAGACVFTRGPLVIGAEPTPGKELLRSMRLSCVRSASLSVMKPDSERSSGTSSKRQRETSSEAMNPADRVSNVFCTRSAELLFKSSSIKTAAESGNASTENNEICCSIPSSKIRKSFCRRSVTSSPAPFFTVTGTTTSETVVRIRARGS
jgi:hypothetical protein